MTLIGIGLLFWFYRRRRQPGDAAAAGDETGRIAVESRDGLGPKRVLLVVMLLIPLVIPSDWTQDVPAVYGKRHPGLVHSALYPPVRREAAVDGNQSATD